MSAHVTFELEQFWASHRIGVQKGQTGDVVRAQYPQAGLREQSSSARQLAHAEASGAADGESRSLRTSGTGGCYTAPAELPAPPSSKRPAGGRAAARPETGQQRALRCSCWQATPRRPLFGRGAMPAQGRGEWE